MCGVWPAVAWNGAQNILNESESHRLAVLCCDEETFCDLRLRFVQFINQFGCMRRCRSHTLSNQKKGYFSCFPSPAVLTVLVLHRQQHQAA